MSGNMKGVSERRRRETLHAIPTSRKLQRNPYFQEAYRSVSWVIFMYVLHEQVPNDMDLLGVFLIKKTNQATIVLWKVDGNSNIRPGV